MRTLLRRQRLSLPEDAQLAAGSSADFMSWFSEDELEACPACRERGGVSLPEAESFVCFVGGYIRWRGGETTVSELQGRPPPGS